MRKKVLACVLVAGSICGCAYLVGMRKQFQAGRSFFLSDHFGVLALLDVHPEHGARDRSRRAVQARRAAVVRLRDQASFVERQENAEAHRLGSEQAGALRQRAAEEERAAQLRRHQQEQKAATARRRRLHDRAFGGSTLFAAQAPQRPRGPSGVHLEALRGLRGGDVREQLRRGASEAEREAIVALGGLRNLGNTCFANSAVQVLLRLPAFSLWLSEHFCEDGGGGCVLCALRETRRQIGTSADPAPIVVQRMQSIAFPDLGFFGDGAQHDAEEFLQRLLGVAHAREAQVEGRSGVLAGLYGGDGRVTHVERLFGFLEGSYKKCGVCGLVSGPKYQSLNVLNVDVPSDEERRLPWTTTDLYMQWAAQEHLSGENAVDCEGCGRRTEHAMQRRVVTAPNVFMVQSRRLFHRGRALQMSRHVVVPERDIDLPVIGAFELAAVVYHRGQTPTSGHYWCVARAPNGQWWSFNDGFVRRFTEDPERAYARHVHLMVYTRLGGRTDFAGMGDGLVENVGEQDAVHADAFA